MDQDRKDKNCLPSGYESMQAGCTIKLTRKQIPWLDQENEDVQLARVKLAGSGNFEFYLGSAIKNKKLIKAAKQLDAHRSRITDNLLNSCLPSYIRDGYSPVIKIVDGTKEEKTVYYASNQGGQRVYFMRFDDQKINGDKIPVIVRVAVCDKADQVSVLSEITGRSEKIIRSRGGL